MLLAQQLADAQEVAEAVVEVGQPLVVVLAKALRGWPELVRIRPGLLRLFVFLVLPLSLLPPAMLCFAGTHHPEMFGDVYSRKPWGQVAAVFFTAEIATLLALCRTREDVVAGGIVQTVIGMGLVAWAFLLLLALAWTWGDSGPRTGVATPNPDVASWGTSPIRRWGVHPNSSGT